MSTAPKKGIIMKKLILLAMTAAGAIVFKKKLDEQQAERDLWAEATDASGPGSGLGNMGTGSGTTSQH